MATARSAQIDLNSTPYYHCVSRCVRRSYLCGIDALTGKDYSHRKQWVINRLRTLSSVFSVKVCAYAVMSNHYHTVLFVDKNAAQSWDDAAVLARWAMLFPIEAKKIKSEDIEQPLVQQKIAILRNRLSDISWFMRCMNEPLARDSNKEDECTGRFWEGRFKSQALLDEGALLCAMAYVDLNPVRAQVVSTPEESEFTSIYDRIKAHLKNADQPMHLVPFKSETEQKNTIDFTFTDYLQLVDTTGRIMRAGKRGAIPQHMEDILSRLQLSVAGWFDLTENLENRFSFVVGNTQGMRRFGSKVKNRAQKGMGFSKRVYLNAA